MTAKHTPGPWTAKRVGGGNLTVFGNNRFAICFMGYLSSDDEEASDLPNAEANAALIASAPDLLAACRVALSALGGRNNEASERIKAALAKAEGRAP
jgi:hypothetical protein